MAEWRKVLVSGSNAHIAAITASVVGTVSEDTEVVFRQNSTGRFFTSGSDFNVKYTSSDGGQLYLDNIGLTAYNISASGVPNNVQDNSQVMFWHPDHGGLQATSSLHYDATNHQLEFDGVYSGSFAGDGSGLTGVIGTLAFPLTNANGIISSSGDNFSYDGSTGVTFQVATASDGGLDFTNGQLHLVSSLAGDALYWAGGTGNYSTLSLDLAANSGLDTSSAGLKLNDNLPGDGLEYTGAGTSTLRIKLPNNSGLFRNSSGIRLAAGLPGTGLEWANNYDELQVNSSEVVTDANFIVMKTGSSNLTMTADASTTAVDGGYKGFLIDNPIFTYDLNSTLTGDFTIDGDTTIEGNFEVSGTFTSVSFDVENVNIADRFILVNSSSNASGNGGFSVQSLTNQAAFMFWDSASARWGVSDRSKLKTTTDQSIHGAGYAAIVTTVITASDEANIISAVTPVFGTSDNDKLGQFVITTTPATNESSVYIYA